LLYGEWKTARVLIDYHVEVDHHYHSVPHALVGENDVRLSPTTLELFTAACGWRRTRVATAAACTRR
jgi:hypothetical protein